MIILAEVVRPNAYSHYTRRGSRDCPHPPAHSLLRARLRVDDNVYCSNVYQIYSFPSNKVRKDGNTISGSPSRIMRIGVRSYDLRQNNHYTSVRGSRDWPTHPSVP